MRTVGLFMALALTAFASANAVMGYALEQYDPRAWIVYVVATVVFEAWAIGRWAGFGWPKAVGVSIVANLLTAFCCTNLCGVGLHQTFMGSAINPNPFLNMVVMFTVFGALSGWIESAVWRLLGAKKTDNSTALRSIGTHLAWVPLGMAIMLVPERPYPMLEGYTQYARQIYLRGLIFPLETKIGERDRIPDYHDISRFFREIVREPSPDAWAMAYRPAFGRFAMGQPKEEIHWEWNPKASGFRIDSPELPEKIWLLRTVRRPQERHGYGLILEKGNVRYAWEPEDLGYPY